jgi:hypothetical protein
LKSPTSVATTTVNLPKGAVARLAIADSGNHRVQIWTLWESSVSKPVSIENVTFEGLVGANTLFQSNDWNNGYQTTGSFGPTSNNTGESKTNQYSNNGASKQRVTPETVIKCQSEKIEQQRQ